MKINVNRKNLMEALKLGGMVAGKCKTIPILDCCKVSIKGGKMVVISTDLEVTIAKKVSINSSEVEHYDFCVVPSDLTSILATIRDENIILDVDNNYCVLEHSRGNAKVSVLPSADFPTTGGNENKTSFAMDATKLKSWLDSAKNFVVEDPLRPALGGMYFAIEDGEIWSCASDSFKLHLDGYKDLAFSSMNLSMVIPSRVFGYASSMLDGYASVTVQADDNNIAFVVSDAKISSRLIVGAYPKVKQLTKLPQSIFVEVNSQDFADSISRMKLFADKVSKAVTLSFSSDGIKLTSSDLLTNKSCEDFCDVLAYDGDSIEICTKTDSLAAIMPEIKSETFMVSMTTEKSPIVIREADNPNKVLFTMPLLKPKNA